MIDSDYEGDQFVLRGEGGGLIMGDMNRYFCVIARDGSDFARRRIIFFVLYEIHKSSQTRDVRARAWGLPGYGVDPTQAWGSFESSHGRSSMGRWKLQCS